MDVFKLFRTLIQACLFFLALAIVTSFLGDEPPEEVTAYLDGEVAGPLFKLMVSGSAGVQIAVGMVMISYFLAWIASLIGMLDFRPWARRWFIVLTIVGIPLLLFTGTSLVSALQGTLEALLNTCTGAILALLFTEPVRGMFEPRALA